MCCDVMWGRGLVRSLEKEREEGGLVMSALNMAMNGNAYKMIEIKKVSAIYILYDNTFLSYDDQLDFFQNMGWRNSFGKV